jgi:polysaccharide export outer membrane protein
MRGLMILLVLLGLSTTAVAQGLQAGDTISISVFQDPKLDRQMVVGPTGMISFPLAGHIRAGGMTPQALENELRRRLASRYTGDLDINVSVAALAREDDTNRPRIYVTGEVARPGPYPILTKTNVLQALAMSGGLGPFAAQQRIQVRRRERGTESVYFFNYKAYVEAGQDIEGNIDLRAGDVVIVPERRLFE